MADTLHSQSMVCREVALITEDQEREVGGSRREDLEGS